MASSWQEDPFGWRPGGGISLPEYYRPCPAITDRNLGRRTDLAPLARSAASGGSEVVAIGQDIDLAEPNRLFTSAVASGAATTA